MILRKVHFPFFIVQLLLGYFFFSCTRKTPAVNEATPVSPYHQYITPAEDFIPRVCMTALTITTIKFEHKVIPKQKKIK